MENNINLNLDLLDADFKDESPLKTVAHIKQILKDNGISTMETWVETNVPYCYVISIRVVGTTFVVNGKGLTKEFTLASGYGELMERLQLGYIGRTDVQKDGYYAVNDMQNVTISSSELLERNRPWYQTYSKRLQKYTNESLKPEDIMAQFADADASVNVTPFFNIVTGKREYLPTKLRKSIYATNGCAAGNTMEEAIVQGISEIVERHHQLRIIEDELNLPDIPEEVLQSHKVAYKIISYVREHGLHVSIKDCSLGTKYPVVCACFIDKKTGRYHTHFGAYPIFEIALERALTESFQGNTIATIAKFDDFYYKASDTKNTTNISKEIAKGTSEKAVSFFAGTPHYAFNEHVGFHGSNNKELFRECMEFFSSQGYDILIRDSSCLGFPTYQVIIPGYSEVMIRRLSPNLNELRYAPFAVSALRDPASAKLDVLLGCLMHINQLNSYSNYIRNIHGFLAAAKLSATLSKKEELYLMHASLGHINYTLGKRSMVIKHLDKMLEIAPETDQEYLLCIKRYLSMVVHNYDSDTTRQFLTVFHNEHTVNALYARLAEKKNLLDPFVLRCNLNCSDTCLLYGRCCQQQIANLSRLINDKTKDLDFQNFAQHLQSLLLP